MKRRRTAAIAAVTTALPVGGTAYAVVAQAAAGCQVAYQITNVGNGGFNLMFTTWRFTGNALAMQWKWLRNQDAPDGHNTRIIGQ
jgi:hypothetical protein